MQTTSQQRIAVLSSGREATCRFILDAIEAGTIPNAAITAIVSNNPTGPIWELAEEKHIPCHHISSRTHEQPYQAIRDLLLAEHVDLIVLCGYLKKVGPDLIGAFEGRILNFHPGPTPRFGGQGMIGVHIQEAVLAAGAPYSGPTIHLVDEEYDHGQVLAHLPVAVKPDDIAESLHERVIEAARPLYVRTICETLARLRS